MEKPKTIKVFDILFAASMVLTLGSETLNWDAALGEMRSDPATAAAAPGVMIIAAIAGYGVTLLLYFISRRRSNIARWIMTALTVIGSVPILFDTTEYATDPVGDLVFWSTFVLCIVQTICLFLPGSARWFRGRPGEHIPDIRETFD